MNKEAACGGQRPFFKKVLREALFMNENDQDRLNVKQSAEMSYNIQYEIYNFFF